MDRDEITDYRYEIEKYYATRRKSLRAFNSGRRKNDLKKYPSFIDTPFIAMLLLIILEGLFLIFSE